MAAVKLLPDESRISAIDAPSAIFGVKAAKEKSNSEAVPPSATSRT
jgi:hypothetical protein